MKLSDNWGEGGDGTNDDREREKDRLIDMMESEVDDMIEEWWSLEESDILLKNESQNMKPTL